MSKLSDLKTEGEFKVLIMGDSGVGKTCFSATFPGPMLIFDFDLKADSAAAWLRHKLQSEQLSRIEVEQLNPRAEISPIDRFMQVSRDRLSHKKMEFATVVIDSITTFSDACLQHIVRSNPGIKRNETKQGPQPGLQDYGILRREFKRIIPGLLALPCNVVMLAHISIEKDEATGAIHRRAMMDGSFAAELPIYFKEAWRMFVKDGKRFVQTQSDHMFNCRSQIPGLPAQLDVTNGYSEIAKYIK